jgi:Putative auto-transporter adhesin, head GIN domain
VKKYILAVFFFCLVVAASGCTTQGTGSGNVINQTKSVQGVNQVSLEGTGTVILLQGNQESLTIQAEDNIIPHIQSNVNGKTLSLSYDTNTPTPNKTVKFYLTVKDLSSISISGAGKVETRGFKTQSLVISTNGAGEGNMSGLNINKLTVNLSGAGKMNMTGIARDQTITISGAGDYLARDLKSQKATITINGAGKGILNVSSILNAVINGSGEISYLGNPQVSQQINGVGTVKQITA